MSKNNTPRDYEDVERAYEDSLADRYNRDYHEPPIMQWHTQSFADFVTRFHHAGDRVLDLGCGPASLWPYWEAGFKGDGPLVGVDLSPRMIDEARRLHPAGDFRVGSFFDIPADSGSFDMVIVSSAFHHIPDADLPEALSEITRVLDEHGVLVGREPLAVGRIGDRGGWVGGALMGLRHLVYRLTHTREYPEPDPGPAHHAYEAEMFLDMIEQTFNPMQISFKNPISPFLARVRHPVVAQVARLLDESVDHREGQEILYAARKNHIDAKDVSQWVRLALADNKIDDLAKVLALVEAAAKYLEAELAPSQDKQENGG